MSPKSTPKPPDTPGVYLSMDPSSMMPGLPSPPPVHQEQQSITSHMVSVFGISYSKASKDTATMSPTKPPDTPGVYPSMDPSSMMAGLPPPPPVHAEQQSITSHMVSVVYIECLYLDEIQPQ